MAWRRTIRRLLFWGLSGTLISLAVLLALVQLALPWWASNPDRVARLLSSRLGSPVEIQSARPYWRAGGPVIELYGVRFGVEGSTETATIERASWTIDFAGLVRSGRAFSEFSIHGLDLTVARNDDGAWQVLGLPELLTGGDRQPLTQSLRALPALSLRDSRLVLRESSRRPERVFLLRELRRFGAGTGTHWRGRVALDEVEGQGDPGQLLLALDLGSGRVDRLYVSGEALDLAAWVGRLHPLASQARSGRVDVQTWIGFDHAGIHDVQLEWRQSESTWLLESDNGDRDGESAPVLLPALELAARWQRDGDIDRLMVDELRIAGADAGRVIGRFDQGEGAWLRVSDLELSAFARFATITGRLPSGIRQWLERAQPRGRLAELDLFLSAKGRPIRLAAHLDAFAVDAGAGMPGVHGLGLRLRADRDGLVLWPTTGEIELDYPGVFAAPVRIRPESGALAAWHDPEFDAWWLALDQLALAGDGYQAKLAGELRWRPGEPLFLDLGAHVHDSEAEALQAFLPINRIPNTSRWLNQSMRGGRVSSGDVWVRGHASDFPFTDHSGHLEARVEVEQAGLRFHPDWPPLTELGAELIFVNNSMQIVARRANVAGIAIAASRAEVDNTQQPVMRLRAGARASGEQMLALIAASPMQGWFGEHLQGMALHGRPRVAVDMVLPLRKDLGEITVDGRLEFSGERFTDSRWNLDFDALEGVMRFDRGGLSIDDLGARLAGEPARLELRIGSRTREPLRLLEGRLHGWLSADAIFGGIEALAPVLPRTRGRANWQVEVDVPRAASDVAGRIRVESDLRGIALALPAPLTKSVDSLLPLHLQAGTTTGAQPLIMRLGQVLSAQARLPAGDQPFAGSVALGGASPEQLPARGLVITGQVPALDLSGWLSLGWHPGGTAVDAGAWPRVLLRAGELGVFGRRFREVDLQVRPGQGEVEVQLRGPQIQGQVQWPLSAGEPVRGRFQRLHLPGSDEQALGDGLAPTSMPGLDVEADDLRVGDSRLGSARLSARVAGDQYRIDTFATRSPAFEMDASGDWQRLPDGDRSRLRVQLRADDLGAMLESFGFAALVRGGRTVAGIEGHWAGSPAAFALENIDGRLDLDVGAGRIVDVDPGVGRLFGLLNLREIPRRLILDFRDFFSQGLRFNSIVGSFRLDVGDAWTEDLVLRSSSADILTTGRTGLAARDYDQVIEVTPRLGGTLPVVGAIAGGPAGAAAGLVMQGLLRIDEASRTIYHVTGSWDDPEIIKQEPEPEPPRRRSATRNN